AELFPECCIETFKFLQGFLVLLLPALFVVGFFVFRRVSSRLYLVQGEHRHKMVASLKFRQGFASYLLAGGVGRRELGMFFLQIQEFSLEQVILIISDGRTTLVVRAVVPTDLLDEFGVTCFGLSESHGTRITQIFSNGNKPGL